MIPNFLTHFCFFSPPVLEMISVHSKITMVQKHISVLKESPNVAGELLCVLRSHSVVVPVLSCDILHATMASFWFLFQITRGNGGKKLISLNRRLQS